MIVTLEMEDDVLTELKRRAEGDVVLRGLLQLMKVNANGDVNQHRSTHYGNGESSAAERPPNYGRGQLTAEVTPRQRGRDERHSYAKEHGMIPQGGIVYQHRGHAVIMPFATERNRDHWFLGAPVGLFQKGEKQFLVLLCWKNGEVLDFVIPPEKATEIIPRLTVNSNGQVMFNVVRRNANRYELLVPKCPQEDITQYLRAHNLLNGR